jgi:hypothetical protein
MENLTLILVAALLLSVFVAAMIAVVYLRKKPFTSCGCSSVTVNGERIRCPACPEKDAVAEPDPAGVGK